VTTPLAFGAISIGSIRKSDGGLILAIKFPTLDSSGHEVVFFEGYEAKLLPLTIDDTTILGPFTVTAGGASVAADIGRFRRLLPFILVLKERGDRTTAIIKTARHFAQLKPENVPAVGRFRRTFDYFATLSILTEAGVVLSNEVVLHADTLTRFNRALTLFDTEWMENSIEMSALEHDDEFIASLRFTSVDPQPIPGATRFVPLNASAIANFLGVMRKANERQPPAFVDPTDFEHAEDELKFSLRPDIHPVPATARFARVDAWLAVVDGTAAGAIGIAIFDPPEVGCWITWYGTARGHVGLGSFLMALVASIAKERGFEELLVWTTAPSSDALKAYARTGFVETQIKPPDIDPTDAYVAFQRTLADIAGSYPICLHLRA
jgi:GNAT superfamily N-acetyltransferase